jgi:hypothetical protein
MEDGVEFGKLMEARRVLRDETRRAIHCVKPKEKVDLVDAWKKKYSTVMVDQLVRIAKDKRVRLVIAAWDLDGFDMKRGR